MKPLATLLIALALAFLGACARYTYSVTLEPKGDDLSREVAIQRHSPSVQSPDGVDPPSSRTELIRDRFSTRSPADVGSAGVYAKYQTTLGTLYVYAERIRGDDDLLGQWERQERAIDTLVDLLLTWLDAALAHEKGVGNLRAFVHDQMRRDLKNAALLVRTAMDHVKVLNERGLRSKTPPVLNSVALPEPQQVFADLGVRLVHLAMDRGYLTIDELPAALRLWEEANNARPADFTFVRRKMLERMGRDGEQDGLAIEALKDAASWTDAFKNHIAASPEAQNILRRWVKAERPGLRTDSLDLVLSELHLSATGHLVTIPFDVAEMSLRCPVPPHRTNGTWDAESGAVRWTTSVPTESYAISGPAPLAHAAWSIPNDDAQRRLFGRVVIHGEDLETYCLWRNGLTSGEAERWERFLIESGGRPEHLASFRLRNQPDAGEPPAAVQALMKALQPPL